jgi:hypothetical protein
VLPKYRNKKQESLRIAGLALGVKPRHLGEPEITRIKGTPTRVDGEKPIRRIAMQALPLPFR